MREEAAEALGQIGDVRAVMPLIRALQDTNENEDFREVAADTLGNLRDARAVEPLIRTLEDASIHVRAAASKALGNIRDVRAVQHLIEKIQWKFVDSEDESVWRAAAKALGQIRDNRAIEPLIALAKITRGKIEVFSDLIEALGQFNDARVVETLVGSLHYTRVTSREIEECGCDTESVTARDRSRCSVLVDALVRIGSSAVFPLLRKLEDNDPHVRDHAIDALGRIGDLRALDPLIKHESKRSSEVLSEAIFMIRTANGAARESLQPNSKSNTRSSKPLTVVVARSLDYKTLSRSDLYIRGEGPGLRWDCGVRMESVDTGVWAWFTSDATSGFVYRILAGDKEWEDGGDYTAEVGVKNVIEPVFW